MQNDMSFGSLDNVEDDGFDLVPAGEYNLRAVDIELKDTRAGTGKFFNVQFEVVDGLQAGRKIFETYNVKNPNQTAVEIGLKNIKQWIVATGQNASGDLTLSRVYALEGKQFVGKVAIQNDKTGQYDDKNVIKRYKASVNQAAPMGGGQQPAQFQQQPQQHYQQPAQQQQFMQQSADYLQQGQPVQSGQQQWQGGAVEQAPVQAQQMGGTFQQETAPNVAGNSVSTPAGQPIQQQQNDMPWA